MPCWYFLDSLKAHIIYSQLSSLYKTEYASIGTAWALLYNGKWWQKSAIVSKSPEDKFLISWISTGALTRDSWLPKQKKKESYLQFCQRGLRVKYASGQSRDMVACNGPVLVDRRNRFRVLESGSSSCRIIYFSFSPVMNRIQHDFPLVISYSLDFPWSLQLWMSCKLMSFQSHFLDSSNTGRAHHFLHTLFHLQYLKRSEFIENSQR